MPIRLGPDVHTKFHIDLDWWRENRKDIRIFIKGFLCDECKKAYAESDNEPVDVVNPETGEVTQADPLWYSIQTCCSRKPNYITLDTPIIDSIFLTFLANGNQPLSVLELYERLDKRPPETILRMLTRGPTYLGIRQVKNN